jgi:hypothetical protein
MTKATGPSPVTSNVKDGNRIEKTHHWSRDSSVYSNPSQFIQDRESVSKTPNLALTDRPPLPYLAAARAVIRCVGRTVGLLVHRRLRQPREHVGRKVHFADGTMARVYRETVVDAGATKEPCVLIVGFRLRAVRGAGHAVFRAESLLNTPLFVGFPGFVSKLWLASDENGTYRGVYEWDGPDRADHYARSLFRVLALVSVPGSIHYVVVPGLRRDKVLDAPHLLNATTPTIATEWWRVVAVARISDQRTE